jgi:hypothetical protein
LLSLLADAKKVCLVDFNFRASRLQIPYKEFFVEIEITKCSRHGHKVDIRGRFVQK